MMIIIMLIIKIMTEIIFTKNVIIVLEMYFGNKK